MELKILNKTGKKLMVTVVVTAYYTLTDVRDGEEHIVDLGGNFWDRATVEVRLWEDKIGEDE